MDRRLLNEGFTLIEMLVVLIIIGLLAGLVGPKLYARVDTSKVQTTEAQVKMLKGALETMRLDTGHFPTTTEGLALLCNAPADPHLKALWKGPYLDQCPVPNDGWGNPFQYALLSGNPQEPFALYSYGADGKPGGTGIDADIGILPPQ